jgi:hypothetical protein
MKQYFLFGGQAVATYQMEGVNGLKDIPFGVYKWEDGKSSPLDLLDAYCGWESFIKITEEEFEQLFMQAWC